MASPSRPDPDELLRRVTAEEQRARRGTLTIFFGAAPGVGKTYAMLEAARTEKDLKRDLVVGIVETHGRYDTAALLLGLEVIPRRKYAHRGVTLEELDLDAALTRRPGLLLVDELAHTNAEGARHGKRWQDVEELLDVGIDVYTTLNVQHLESLVDVVAQITGVVVGETVPDSVFDEAHDVRLIDLPPDELLARLSAGQVYVAEQAGRARDGFFRKGNLIALRELALRRTAERVDAQMHVYKQAQGIERAWPVTERLVVCVSPSPASARLVRAARRMATGLRATWLAVYVETPASLRMSSADKERVAHNLRLAEQLGGETVVLGDPDAAEATIRFARTRNVTKILVGKPTHPRWRDLFSSSFLERIVRGSRDIDVYVISGDGREPARESVEPQTPRPVERGGLLAALAAVAAATAIGFTLFGRTQLTDVVMTYLLGTVLVSMRYGYRASMVTTVLGVLTFDFLFVPPYLSFAVSDFRHVVTFAIMFVVAFVISRLTQRTRDQAEAARHRELRTARLYAMSRELAATQEQETLVAIAGSHLHDAFAATIAVLLPDEGGALRSVSSGAHALPVEGDDLGVAEWVWAHGKPAGWTTDTLPSSSALFVPLVGSRGRVGVLGVRPTARGRIADPEQRHVLEAFAAQLASALERARLSAEAQRSHLEIEAERLRSSLLSSVSHDLRTPLGVITGASSSLLTQASSLSVAARDDLLETIHEEAERLNRLVGNLLDMTRVASGALQLAREWHPVEELVGVALARLETRLGARAIELHLAADLPPVAVDAVLVEQVLINLLENALKYTPAASPIAIGAAVEGGAMVIEVADRGPGVAAEERERVFEKFYQVARGGGGAGLGLAICRGVIDAHGGRIWVEAREGGGAAFRFALPLQPAPEVPRE